MISTTRPAMLMTRASLTRRILTAPFRWHNRFEAWLEEQDPQPLIHRCDQVSQTALITVAAALVGLVLSGSLIFVTKVH